MATSSQDQERNVEVALGSLDRWLAGDVEGTLATLADDVEVFVPSELANPGRLRGHDAFLAWAKEWEEAWADLETEVEEIAPVGARHVVASVHLRAKGSGSGIPVEMTLAYLTEVREEKIVILHLYPTTEEARRVAEQLERA